MQTRSVELHLLPTRSVEPHWCAEFVDWFDYLFDRRH